MQILVVSQYFWPENFRVNDLVKELISRGHGVTVLTGIPNYPSGKTFKEYQSSRHSFSHFETARVYRVPMVPRGVGKTRLIINYLSFVVGAVLWGPWYLRRIKPDVIFVFEPSPITVGLPAILLGKIKKAPVVFWVLDLWPETLTAIGVVRSQHILKLISYLVRYVYRHCTLILGQSKSFIKSIGKHCDDKNKIYYFPNWAEEHFANGSACPAEEVPVQADYFNIVFTGNIGEAQDMPAILDAAQLLRDKLKTRWIIVGNGRKAGWLQSEIISRQLQDIVLMPGQYPRDRMQSFYAHADALLVSLKCDPVFSMTIPGKVQSYLLSGIPLLGMLDGEGAAVIRDANAGLTCNAGDSVGLAQAILTLSDMTPQKRKELGLNGRKFAQKEFGRTQLIDRLETLLIKAVVISKTNP